MSSTESDVDIPPAKTWNAIDRLSIRWKFDLSEKIKAVAVSILLYGCTSWAFTKRIGKMLDRNYTRMLRAVLNKF